MEELMCLIPAVIGALVFIGLVCLALKDEGGPGAGGYSDHSWCGGEGSPNIGSGSDIPTATGDWYE